MKESLCDISGKDQIIFVTKEDHEKPSTAVIKAPKEEEPGKTELNDGMAANYF